MYKVGICGHFGFGKNLLNGQTVKTKILSEELKNVYGADNISEIDTHNWIKSPFKLLINSFTMIKNCENIIILPAHKGVKLFLPLFSLLNIMFKKKLHYVVIGAWLPELISESKWIKIFAEKFDGIYVETEIMIKKLYEIGLENIRYLPNFKKLNILDENDLVYNNGEPYKICTLSRVMKEKGIEDAIEVVKSINTKARKVLCTLDIYGDVESSYKDDFQSLAKCFPKYVNYKGSVAFDKTVEVIKQYYLLLFPTHFKTEGIPGTIIDAYASGVPVIASKWNSVNDIVKENITGYIYNIGSINELEDILFKIINSELDINPMKKKCLIEASNYSPEVVIKNITNYL